MSWVGKLFLDNPLAYRADYACSQAALPGYQMHLARRLYPGISRLLLLLADLSAPLQAAERYAVTRVANLLVQSTVAPTFHQPPLAPDYVGIALSPNAPLGCCVK